MAIAPRSCVTAVLTFRSAVFVLQAAALVCAMMAGETALSVFIFLKFVLAVHLFLDAALLMYEAAQVFLQEPVLPPQRWEIVLVVIADWVVMIRCWVEFTCGGGLRRQELEELPLAASYLRASWSCRCAHCPGICLPGTSRLPDDRLAGDLGSPSRCAPGCTRPRRPACTSTRRRRCCPR